MGIIAFITTAVAPFAGAWIEIYEEIMDGTDLTVAPFAGAWIEISGCYNKAEGGIVAPFAGAWIEIRIPLMCASSLWSLPLRERGLK